MAFEGVFAVVVAAAVVDERNRLMKEDGEVENGDGVVRESRKLLLFVSNS